MFVYFEMEALFMSIIDMFSHKSKVKSKRTLNIILVGCGKVGVALIKRLSEEGNNVTFIDRNEKLVNKFSTELDAMGFVGNGASYKNLTEAGIDKADLFIAVTESDELNLLCCTVAKKVSHCSTIARVRNPVYSEEQDYLKEQLGLSKIINPDLEAAKEIVRILKFPAALSVSSFAKGHAELIRFKVPNECYLDGKILSKIQEDCDFTFLVCAVERNDNITIPNGNQNIKGGDIITIIATPKNAYRFFRKMEISQKRISSVMIIGGGRTAFYITKLLGSSVADIKIIENNFERCEELNVLLGNSAHIINGDGTDEKLLEKEDIKNVDAFIPATGIDEENILLTLYAKNVTNAKVITKVNRINFNSVISSLELGSLIHPRLLTAEAILAYARGKKNSLDSCNIETLYHWFDNRVEAIEFKVMDNCDVTDIPLYKLNIKENVLVACISRNGNVIIPRGQDCIQNGDYVTIVTTYTGFESINDILA